MKSKNTGASSSTRLTSSRSFLIVAEFSISMVLLAGAGLLIHSFLLAKEVDPGFESEHVLTLRMALNGTSDWPVALYDTVLGRLQAVPGVRSVGAIDSLFDLGPTHNLGLRIIEGRAPESQDRWTPLTWDTVRGDYFQAIGAQLMHGRYFTSEDGPDTPLVAIVDESAARRYWPRENPVGKRFKGQDHRGHNDDWLTVIGVIHDIHTHGLDRRPTPHIYEWYSQASNVTPEIVIRTAADPKAIAATLRKVARDAAPNTVLSDATPIREELSQQLAPRRFQTSLLGVFSLLALALASVGIYGLMHYTVAQRTREIGIRTALGAQRSDILGLIVGRGMKLALLGIGIGLAAALALTRLMASLLFGVGPFDLLTFSTV